MRRAGYEVRLQPVVGGSWEENPPTILDYIRRDQRWCQGNLQHLRLLFAPGLRLWSRVTLLQGAFSYLLPPIWLVLLLASMTEAALTSGRHARIGPSVPAPEVLKS